MLSEFPLEEEFFGSSDGEYNEGDRNFDEAIGILEDLLVDDEFSTMQNDYLDQNCNQFEDNDENKICYTKIFNEYVELLEKWIESKLSAAIDGFDINIFLQQVSEREEQMCTDVMEMLLSLTDFMTFKSLMIDRKKAKQNEQSPTSAKSPISSLPTQTSSLNKHNNPDCSSSSRSSNNDNSIRKSKKTKDVNVDLLAFGLSITSLKSSTSK